MYSQMPGRWYAVSSKSTVANLGEFHFREVPRGSVSTEPGEGSVSKKLLENRTLNGGFLGTLNLKLLIFATVFFAGKNVFTDNLDRQKYIILSELICLMEMLSMF